MKRLLCALTALLCVISLCGCFGPRLPDEAPLEDTNPLPTEPSQATQPTNPPETTAPTEPAEVTEPTVVTEPTEPEHSELYIEGVEVEDVIRYFNEVCLDGEYVISGDPSVVQKWMAPIFYVVHGDPTEEDLQVLNEFTTWLNTYPGFPGIYEGSDSESANLQIYFCSREEMHERMGHEDEMLDGMVTFWYDYDVIYDAIICIRNDLDQYTRNSVILEELYNGLGPIQDTQLRPDSLIYAEYALPQELTEVDELILKLLYHPDMKCGMNAEECEAVIRQLYY